MHACGDISAHADPRGQAWELKPCYPGALLLSRPQRRSNTPSSTASHPAPEPFRPIIEDDTPREIRGGRPQRLSSTPVKERPWSHKEAARRQKQRKKDAPSLLHPAPARHPWAHQRLVLEGHCPAAGKLLNLYAALQSMLRSTRRVCVTIQDCVMSTENLDRERECECTVVQISK